MKALQGGTRIAFLSFFGSHIIFTLLTDLQAISKPYYPQILQDLVTNYAATVQDPLMSEPFELWFQSMVVCELLFQVPYFFVAVYMFSDATRQQYPRWFQMISIIYGSHTATTLVPILPTIWFRDNGDPDELVEVVPVKMRLLCLAIYLPYLLFPLAICIIAAFSNDDSPETTANKVTKSKSKSK